MSCRQTLPIAILLVICGACGRPPAKLPTERIAILRFENLSADRSVDWMGRAFSEIITTEVASAPGIYAIPASQIHVLDQQMGVQPISAPGVSAERGLALYSGATQAGYGDYSIHGDRLRARLTLEDLATGQMIRTMEVQAPAGDIAGAASRLAHQIAGTAGAYPTANSAAIEAYVTAWENRGRPEAVELAARAIAVDPNFGPAYRLLAGLKAGQQDVPGALAVLADAARRGDAIPAAERARIDFEAANLRNDAAGRVRALAGLVKVTPGDMEAWRSLGEFSYASRNYSQAIAAYQKLLALQPDDPAVLNQLGYAYANAGRLDDAVASLHRYATLRPTDANAQDSTGDVYLLSGHPSEAANFYLQAYGKNPNLQGSAGADLFKAAMAKLMAGDLPGADALEKQFDDSRTAAHNSAVPFRQAEWAWLTGRRKQAIQSLDAFAQKTQGGPLKDLASRAYSELAVWSLMLGDRAGAAQNLAKAAPIAGPTSAATVVLVRFLAQPPASAAEWSSRAAALFRNPGQDAIRDLWLGYALLLGKQYDAAVPVLRRLHDSGASSDESIPVLLAWALAESGHVDDAAPLLRFNPVPPMTGIGLFTSWYFPRLFYLRAVVAEKQGRADEARTNRKLFLELSGPTPLSWGEEQKARQSTP